MSGNDTRTGLVLLFILLIPLFLPPAGAQGEGTVTRSQTFTVTITGTPYTAYDVWLKGTFSMSGKPGDQPPVIEANQENVVQDPSGGPFVIGSYRYYNGGGRTILDDVAPSSSTVANTSYYAQVTTDANGIGVVAFRTSQNTAAQSFSIAAQNPAAPAQDVSITLGTPAARVITQVTTIPAAAALPTAVPATTVTALPVVDATLEAASSLSPAGGPVNTPPTTIPLPAVIAIIAAAGTAFLVLPGRKRG
jgi:hypothetical protein